MTHFISFLDHKPELIRDIVDYGMAIKGGTRVPLNLRDKTLGMMFFNPSLRTRVSFEQAMTQFGGQAITLSASGDVWNLEFEDGAVMNGTTVEHVKDASRVLSRYLSALSIRSFGELKSLDADLEEKVLRSFAKYAEIPVVSMESACEHPAQSLADMMTIKERHGDKKVKFVLSWAPHIKALPTAVPHSALLAAAHLGLDITVAHPEGFDLAPRYIKYSKKVAEQFGGSFSTTSSQEEALDGAVVVYAKNWAPPAAYGDAEKTASMLAANQDWLVTQDKIASAETLLHCLPVRRNVEVADSALDGPASAIYDEAENRLWAQAALLDTIFELNNIA